MPSIEKYKEILQQYWGYTDFRPLQDEIILSIASGCDTLGLMPTGGGKSITFQVPAIAMSGTCIVVTPLIALMKDQVENLRERGIRAIAIYSGMTRDEIIVALENCILGDYKFLYVSPERLATDIFLKKMAQMAVSFVVVDEAHCISQWGYDFRPSYLRIADIRALLPENTAILALTATATPEVITDIQDKLLFRCKNVFQKSFERKNLSYVVRKTADKPNALLKILNSVDGSAIVYVRDRKKTKETADYLNINNITAEHFHAGLKNTTKDQKQKAWKNGFCRVMVATNAFGMGIDKSDVRLVIHLDLPDSLEAYFQEAGRAGRDEKRAYAVLLYSSADKGKLHRRIPDNYPEKDNIRRTYEALCNYFQVAMGHGAGNIFDFNLIDFCSTFRFPIIPTFSALKILQQAGYIELTDELDNLSRFMFTVHRDELYKIKMENPLFDGLLNMLLRLHSGMFSEFVRINEDELATRLKMTRDEIYESMSRLNKLLIINYIPGKKTPFIIFSRERQNHDTIRLTAEVYEKRRKRFEERIESVIRYADGDDVCRSKMLLAYFGEKHLVSCQVCDVCLQGNQRGLKTDEFTQIQHAVNQLLQSSSGMPIEKLVAAMEFPEDKSIQVIRFMLDNQMLCYNDDKHLKLSLS